ncbi:hypothetical protein AALC25_17220 [Lachnospiraceae bacterium 29-84]
MDRSGFILLSVLEKSRALSRLSSMTVKEIAREEDFGIGENTIYKKLKGFELSGHISRGMKESRADTYYITEKGCKCLEEERSRG